MCVDRESLQSAYRLIKDKAAAGTGGRIAPELYVVCAETALQVRMRHG